MSAPLTIKCVVHCRRHGHGSAKTLAAGAEPAPQTVVPGRVPRLARLMALAIRFEGLLRAGHKQADLAQLGHVSRARISQILSLVHLAPDIQEAILFLPRVQRGRAPLILAKVLPIAAIPDWKKQRHRWQALRREGGSADRRRAATRRPTRVCR
jgi:hypothetical protein